MKYFSILGHTNDEFRLLSPFRCLYLVIFNTHLKSHLTSSNFEPEVLNYKLKLQTK